MESGRPDVLRSDTVVPDAGSSGSSGKRTSYDIDTSKLALLVGGIEFYSNGEVKPAKHDFSGPHIIYGKKGEVISVGGKFLGSGENGKVIEFRV